MIQALFSAFLTIQGRRRQVEVDPVLIGLGISRLVDAGELGDLGQDQFVHLVEDLLSGAVFNDGVFQWWS